MSQRRSAAGLHVEDHGPTGGPLVLLVHGSMDRSVGLAKVAHRLDQRCHVVRYDRRGYGRSRPHPGPFGLAEHIDDLVSVLDGRPAVLVGHSFGGDIVLAAVERHPELALGAVVFRAPTVVGAVVAGHDGWRPRGHRRRRPR